MKSITININDNQLADKVLWLLEHFQKGVKDKKT
jgi:hypothetical protein